MKKKWWAASLAVAMVITSVPAIPAAVYAAEPMLIEAEDYSSYSGKLKVMTNNKNASGGKYVGDFDNLDCLSYKIQIEKAGNYQITLTVGTIQDGGIALLNCGGNVSEKISIPNTKNWNTYRDVTATLWLDEGEQKKLSTLKQEKEFIQIVSFGLLQALWQDITGYCSV